MSGTTSFTFSTGIEGQTYYFAVAAYAAGQVVGPLSAEVSATASASSPPPPDPPPPPTPVPGNTVPAVPVAMTRNGGSCGPLPAATGRVITVGPSQATLLSSIIGAAQPGDTFQFADGTYTLKQPLAITAARVTLRSQSGNRGSVVLDGAYAIGDLITIAESDVVVADLTLTRSRDRAVRVAPATRSVYGTILHNLRIADGFAAAVQVAPAAGFFADNGVVECSTIELSDTARAAMQARCEIAGVSADAAANWQLAVNTFTGFWCSSGAAGPAVRFGAGSRGTVVDRSVILNSARGIVLGTSSGVADRTYADQPCSGKSPVGHYGGVVVNNAVAVSDARVFTSGDGFQTGIALEQSCGTNVLHNTVASTQAPRTSSIEWRLPNTVATVANNLVSHAVAARDGATATAGGNVAGAPLSFFTDASGAGNLHLTARAIGAIDLAAVLSTPVAWDLDGASRGVLSDVGADEFTGIRFTLAAPTQATTLQSLTVSWAADPAIVTSSDWIGLFAVGANTAPLDKKFTGAQATGAQPFTAPSTAGSYELRYFNGGSQLRVATSATLVVTAAATPPPASSAFSISAPAQAAAGAQLTVSWSGDPWKITPSDTIGLFAVGGPDSAPIDKKSTGSLTTGTLTFIAPSTAGTYEFRYFNSNLQVRVATSAAIAVTGGSTPAPPPTPTPAAFTLVGPFAATAGAAMSADWTGDPWKITPSDTVGLFAVGAPDSAPIDKKPTGSLTTGTLTFIAPSTAGTYEFRYFNGNLQVRVATSAAIVITGGSTPAPPPTPAPAAFTLVGPFAATAGAAMSAVWTGDPWKITPSDTIGLFVVGAADASPITNKSTGALTSGSLSFTAPSTAGSYEFRYFNGSQQVRVATSAAISVTASSTPAPAPSSVTLSGPSQAAAGQAFTATWSGDPWKITPSDTIGLFAVGAPDSAPIDKKSTGSLTTGTLTFIAPSPPGTYEFRYFNSNLQVRVATSAAITITITGGF